MHVVKIIYFKDNNQESKKIDFVQLFYILNIKTEAITW